MPLQRRMPKRGFINPFTISYKVFNVEQVDELVEKFGLTEFSPETLFMNGLINRTDRVKVLGRGEIKTSIKFRIHAASAKAKELIGQAGGTIELIEVK